MTKTFEQQEISERAAQMKLVARLSQARCPKCKRDKNADCGCEASTRLKEINANWKGRAKMVKAEAEEIRFKNGAITVEKYKQAKEQGMADTTIQNQLGWHGMKMNRWKRDNGLIGKAVKTIVVEKVEPKPNKLMPMPQEVPTHVRSEFDDKEKEHETFKATSLEVIRKSNEINIKLQKELETAEHYVEQTQKLNEALQGQVDKLAAELKETKESMSGNWRELEQQVKADKLEYEKLVTDFMKLEDSHEIQKDQIGYLTKESDRVNELNTMLMLNTLKIVEKAGDIA